MSIAMNLLLLSDDVDDFAVHDIDVSVHPPRTPPQTPLPTPTILPPRPQSPPPYPPSSSSLLFPLLLIIHRCRCYDRLHLALPLRRKIRRRRCCCCCEVHDTVNRSLCATATPSTARPVQIVTQEPNHSCLFNICNIRSIIEIQFNTQHPCRRWPTLIIVKRRGESSS
jgi:hypothetical protein